MINQLKAQNNDLQKQNSKLLDDKKILTNLINQFEESNSQLKSEIQILEGNINQLNIDTITNQSFLQKNIQKLQNKIQSITQFVEEIDNQQSKIFFGSNPDNQQDLNQIESQLNKTENAILNLEIKVQKIFKEMQQQTMKLQQNINEYQEINEQLQQDQKKQEDHLIELKKQIEIDNNNEEKQLANQPIQQDQNPITIASNTQLKQESVISFFLSMSISSLTYQTVEKKELCEFLDKIQTFYYMGFFNILQPDVEIWEILSQVQAEIIVNLLENKNHHNIQELEKICIKCQQQLMKTQNIIELPCHMYHEECFIKLVEKQIQCKYPQLSCVCECNIINPSIFLKLRDQALGLKLCKQFQNNFQKQLQ